MYWLKIPVTHCWLISLWIRQGLWFINVPEMNIQCAVHALCVQQLCCMSNNILQIMPVWWKILCIIKLVTDTREWDSLVYICYTFDLLVHIPYFIQCSSVHVDVVFWWLFVRHDNRLIVAKSGHVSETCWCTLSQSIHVWQFLLTSCLSHFVHLYSPFQAVSSPFCVLKFWFTLDCNVHLAGWFPCYKFQEIALKEQWNTDLMSWSALPHRLLAAD